MNETDGISLRTRAERAARVIDSASGGWHHHWHWMKTERGDWAVQELAFWEAVDAQLHAAIAETGAKLAKLKAEQPSVLKALRLTQRWAEEDTDD